VFVCSPLVQSVRIFGFHPDGPGSIPGRGDIFFNLTYTMIIIQYAKSIVSLLTCNTHLIPSSLPSIVLQYDLTSEST
jgi:hypothetical protein